ncbi:MAG: type II and III secretion system protein [Verrucomicrobia bacterium]|nr:type II and III secretion system protein [Verrucomicrobiota bacterium]
MKSTFLTLAFFCLTLVFSCLHSEELSKSSSPVKQPYSDDHALIAPDYHEIGVLIEYIQLDHKKANQLLAKFAHKSNDAQELRNTLDTLTEKGSAELLETVWLRCQSGKPATSESVREDLYVTSADPAAIPQKVATKAYMISASPTSFETQKVGTTLKVTATLSDTDNHIKLDLNPHVISRLEDHYFVRNNFEHTARGIQHKSVPTFFSMRDDTAITVKPGKYNLLGIHTPPRDKDKRILVMLRADLILVE